jgi:dTDP-glucose 4,6-dehydratase
VQNVSIFKGDIFNDEDLSTAIMAYQIDAVIHLSAQTSVDASLATPYESSKANVVGTNVVLENCLKHGVKKFVHMSSADVYGKAEAPGGKFREDVAPRPVNPYGASKAASELIVHEYQARGVNTFIVRASNVYGPKQFPDSKFDHEVAVSNANPIRTHSKVYHAAPAGAESHDSRNWRGRKALALHQRCQQRLQCHLASRCAWRGVQPWITPRIH